MNNLKKEIAYYAVDNLIKDGMKIGLGTGSTAGWIVGRLRDLIDSKKIKTFYAVPTSVDTRLKCECAGVPVTDLFDPRLGGTLDLTIDGADEISPSGHLIKGAGGALLLEKIVASVSREYAIVADDSKLVKKLGERMSTPVETIPAGRVTVGKALLELGAESVSLRMATGFCGPVFTEHGNLILDAKFSAIENPSLLEKAIKSIPGVVESGIFTKRVNYLVIGSADGRITMRRL